MGDSTKDLMAQIAKWEYEEVKAAEKVKESVKFEILSPYIYIPLESMNLDKTFSTTSKDPQPSDFSKPPQIARFNKDYPLDKSNPECWVTEGRHDNIYTREWLGELLKKIRSAGGAWTNKIHQAPKEEFYIFGDGASRVVGMSTLEVRWASLYGVHKTFDFNGVRITLTCGPSAVEEIEKTLFLDAAQAITFPDEKGEFKVFFHPASRMGRVYYYGVKDSDGINRSEKVGFKNSDDWEVLKNYITARNLVGAKISRKTICEIVKTISLNLLEAENHETLVNLGLRDGDEGED